MCAFFSNAPAHERDTLRWIPAHKIPMTKSQGEPQPGFEAAPSRLSHAPPVVCKRLKIKEGFDPAEAQVLPVGIGF